MFMYFILLLILIYPIIHLIYLKAYLLTMNLFLLCYCHLQKDVIKFMGICF